MRENVYEAAARGGDGHPDLEDAGRWLHDHVARGTPHVVVVSSAQVFEPSMRHIGLATEDRALPPTRHPIALRWRALEALARETLSTSATSLTLLRPPVVARASGRDYFSCLLRARVTVTLPGHDPILQVLEEAELERAVAAACGHRTAGIIHVPAGAESLRTILRRRGIRRWPVPRFVQRFARWMLSPVGLAEPIDQTDYIRYEWTIASGLASEAGSRRPSAEVDAVADPFGLDTDVIDRLGRSVFAFLHDRYWRVDIDGLEHIPDDGPVVLVGVHRGFFPWDAMMTLHGLRTRTGRVPRFLVHPGLLKSPFFFNLFRRLGGVLACRENMDYVLARGQVLGVFPEGVEGAFRLYRDAHQLGRFRRSAFVRAAVRHGAPIVPFVTLGSAEASPVFARIDSAWWSRRTLWPTLPITPTVIPLPLPLPSRWHTRFLPPVHVSEADLRAPRAARRVADGIRAAMQAALDDAVARRPAVFSGALAPRPPSER